MKDINMNIKHN